MNVISVYIPKEITREFIENALDVMFTKNIEQARLAKFKEGYLFLTKFNTLTFIDIGKAQVAWALERLGVQNAQNFESHMLFQDYPVIINPALESDFKVTNEEIILKESSVSALSIIALVISQSVGLERYEQMLDKEFPKSREILKKYDNSLFSFKRKELMKFASSLTLMRHDIISDMHLLDKPNVIWDDEVAEKIYNALSSKLELRDRFDILEYKLNMLKEDVGIVVDIINHKSSEFLEIVIILLIGIEIVMGLIKH